MTQDQTTEQFVTYVFNVVTTDGELYRLVTFWELQKICRYMRRPIICEYDIPDVWKYLATKLIREFRKSNVCEDRTHVFTTVERDMLADMLAEKYDEIVKEGL